MIILTGSIDNLVYFTITPQSSQQLTIFHLKNRDFNIHDSHSCIDQLFHRTKAPNKACKFLVKQPRLQQFRVL